MSHKQNKLENPERLAELSPQETLKKIGIHENDVICDIGAGSGVFAIPAAKITNNTVYALDINNELLEIIKEKAKKEKLSNIKTMKVTGDHYDIEADTVDCVILVTVLHEIENKDFILTEIKRIIKSRGKLAIIEFQKQQTPMGPPVSHRIGRDEVIRHCGSFGFSQIDELYLGDNFYCIVLNI
ncbi:MAG: methyltransferase domain-containing protein [Firmicutes bacterium]|nr:methyltransferase domain-containing protein [Bacillota bacterium]